jgi:hypothetical protein
MMGESLSPECVAVYRVAVQESGVHHILPHSTSLSDKHSKVL